MRGVGIANGAGGLSSVTLKLIALLIHLDV
jgi:hypothetical protein